MRSDTRLELIQLIELIESRLEQLPTLKVENMSERRLAIRDLQDFLIETEGARFGEIGTSTAMTLAGLRSSSTIDPAMALKNWCFAARRRVGFGAGL